MCAQVLLVIYAWNEQRLHVVLCASAGVVCMFICIQRVSLFDCLHVAIIHTRGALQVAVWAAMTRLLSDSGKPCN